MALLSIESKDVRDLWQERGFDDRSIANAMEISEQRLAEILADGSAKVTEIQKLADSLRLTFTDVLVGSAPTKVNLTDFRTIQSKLPKSTPELLYAVETMTARLEFLVDEELYSGVKIPAQLLQAVERSKPKTAARILREILQIDSAPKSKNSFILWKTRIEELGVVLSSMPLGGAARGIAIYDAPCAAIIIASEEKNDGAKLFSLLHEFAHICRRESAISDQNWSKKTERWCNKFAAHALMPEGVFKQQAELFASNGKLENNFWAVVQELADTFGVSLMAVAYHLDNLGVGSGDSVKTYLSRFSGLFLDEIASEAETESSGNSETHFYTRINDYGLVFLNSVARGLETQQLNRHEVADVLGLKYKYIEPLFEKARARSRSYAK